MRVLRWRAVVVLGLSAGLIGVVPATAAPPPQGGRLITSYHPGIAAGGTPRFSLHPVTFYGTFRAGPATFKGLARAEQIEGEEAFKQATPYRVEPFAIRGTANDGRVFLAQCQGAHWPTGFDGFFSRGGPLGLIGDIVITASCSGGYRGRAVTPFPLTIHANYLTLLSDGFGSSIVIGTFS
jgi:hypothetical protein